MPSLKLSRTKHTICHNGRAAARKAVSPCPATTYDDKKNHLEACNPPPRVYNTHMKATAFIVTRWNDPSPLQTFNTLEEAQQWVMAHFSEWTTFLIEPVFQV